MIGMKLLELNRRLDQLERQGIWLITLDKLRVIFPEESEENLKKTIKRRLADGSLIRVCPGKDRKDKKRDEAEPAAEETPEPVISAAMRRAMPKPLRLKGLYMRPLTRPLPYNCVGTLLNHMRPDDLTYLSLETRLSELGVISQVPSVITCMTTGAGGWYDTAIGTIELVHTKRSPRALRQQLTFDEGRGYYVASPELAYKDLRLLKRTLDLVDLDALAEVIEEEAAVYTR